MFNKINLLFLISLVTSLAFTQISNAQGNELTREQLQDFTRFNGAIFVKSSTSTIGSPYLNDDFYKGYVMLNERSRSETLNLRYNIETNEVEYLKDGDVYLLRGGEISGFIFTAEDGNIEFKNGFRPGIKDVNRNTLMRSVYDGNVKMLVHYKVRLQEDLAKYSSANTTNKYRTFKQYYLVTDDGEFHEIDKPTKDIFDVLSSQRSTLERFTENNDLNLDYEKDIITLLSYYDEISRM
jgi:hypothetical protein